MWKKILKTFNEEDKQDIRYATVRYMLEDSSVYRGKNGPVYRNQPIRVLLLKTAPLLLTNFTKKYIKRDYIPIFV